jgi:tRNA(fMet)-specific endonuclease VapC
MRNILIDTDVLINFLRGKERARDFLASAVSEAVLHVSVITVAELYASALPHEAERTQALLDGLTVVNVTRGIAEKAGAYKRASKSQRLELMDCLIVATAHATRAVLATGNVKHYPMPDIETLGVPSS